MAEGLPVCRASAPNATWVQRAEFHRRFPKQALAAPDATNNPFRRPPVRNKTSWFAVCFGTILALAACAIASAQPPTPRYFSGTISDYTPQNAGGGPWEVRGTWSLKINHDGTANFSAAVNMTHDDYWVDVISPASVNDDTPTGRNPHTHHITL